MVSRDRIAIIIARRLAKMEKDRSFGRRPHCRTRKSRVFATSRPIREDKISHLLQHKFKLRRQHMGIKQTYLSQWRLRKVLLEQGLKSRRRTRRDYKTLWEAIGALLRISDLQGAEAEPPVILDRVPRIYSGQAIVLANSVAVLHRNENLVWDARSWLSCAFYSLCLICFASGTAFTIVYSKVMRNYRS